MKQPPLGGLLGAVHFSPALEGRLKPGAGAVIKAARQAFEEAQPDLALENLGAVFWVIFEVTEKRPTVLVVEGPELGRYFEKRQAGRWRLYVDQSFASRAEAKDFAATVGELTALEDPNKAPRRQGEAAELAALAYLRRVKAADESDARAPRVPWSAKEAELFESISNQFERSKKVLSPKQWALIGRMASQVAERFNRRKASRERESK